MKKLLLTLLVLLTYNWCVAQNKLWSLPDQQMDFGGGTPSFSQLPQPGCTDCYDGHIPEFSHNIMYDAYGDLLFFIIDGDVYDNEGYMIGNGIVNHPSTSFYGLPPGHTEYIVVPVPEECDRWYLIGADTRANEPELFYCILDLSQSNEIHPNRFGLIDYSNYNVSIPNLHTTFDKCRMLQLSVSEEQPDGTYFLYVGTCNYLDKFIINNSTIGLTHEWVQGLPTGVYGFTLRSEMELVRKADGTYLLAFPNFYEDPGLPTGHNWHLLLHELDNNGDFVFQHVLAMQGPTDLIKGIEFSPDGEFLYFTCGEAPYIRFLDTDDLSAGQFDLNDPINITVPNPIDFKDSQIELGRDGKLYFLAQDRMAQLENPNDPGGTATWVDDAFPLETFNFVKTIGDYTTVADIGLRLLTDQIDGQDLDNLINNPSLECCAVYQTFNAFGYTATANEIWEPGNNPFGNTTDDVRIMAGEQLTIDATVTIRDMVFRFDENAQAIVQQGAKLTLDNTTFTSLDCGDELWRGIQVWGDPLTTNQLPYISSNTGYLSVINNSEVSNALNAVLLIREDQSYDALTEEYSYTYDWNYTGGLAQAQHSNFYNNWRDFNFQRYDHNNISYVRECTLETNKFIPTPPPIVPFTFSPVFAHVLMNEIDGVGIYDNDIINTVPGLYSDDKRGIGIRSIDAKYRVSYSCDVVPPFGSPCPEADRNGNTFQNLYYGIRGESIDPFNNVEVKYNDFIDNSHGIMLTGMDAAVVVNNNFAIDNTGFSYGMYMHSCDMYAIENNNFYTNSTGDFGLIIMNSNEGGTSNAVNEVYNNTFTGLERGNVSFGWNKETGDINSGLTYQCNEHTADGLVDIGVAAFGSGGIAAFQGDCGLPENPANNQFSSPTPTIGDLWQNNNVENVSYQYQGSGTYQTEPLDYNSGNTFPTDCGLPDPFEPTNHCPYNRYDDFSRGQLRLRMDDFKNEVATLLANYNTLIDGGDTQGLLDVIATGSNGQVKNALLDASPYLSDEVLLAYLASNPPNGHVKQILIANSRLSEEVMQAVEEIGLPNGIYNQVAGAQAELSPRMELESEIVWNYRQRELYLNELIRQYSHDSTVVDGMDSIISLLKQEGDSRSKCLLTGALVKNKEYTEAQAHIDSMQLAGIHGEFCAFMEQLIVLKQTVKSCMTVKDEPSIKDLAEQMATLGTDKKVCVLAQSLLEMAYNEPIQEVFIPLNATTSMMIIEQEETPPLASLYPSPANNMVTLSLNEWDVEATYEVRIYNLLGEVVGIETITSQINVLDVSILNNGAYLVTLLCNGEYLEQQKLVVSH